MLNALKALLLFQLAEINFLIAAIIFGRDGLAEIDAGVSESPPARLALHQQGFEEKSQTGLQHKPTAAALGVRVEAARQALVFDHAIVIDADGNKHDVAIDIRVVIAQHVIHESEPRFAHLAVSRQAAFEKHRLANTGAGGEIDIAFQHAAVQRIARIAPHEKRPHRFDQGLQRPDARPLADGIRQGGFFRRQKRHQNVIHIAAMIHHEHHAGVLLDVF